MRQVTQEMIKAIKDYHGGGTKVILPKNNKGWDIIEIHVIVTNITFTAITYKYVMGTLHSVTGCEVSYYICQKMETLFKEGIE